MGTHVMRWLDKLIEKRNQNSHYVENIFVVKGRTLMKNIKSVASETKNLFNNIGQIIGVTDTVHPKDIRHDDQENEALKISVNSKSFVNELINNQIKNNESEKDLIVKFANMCKSRINPAVIDHS